MLYNCAGFAKDLTINHSNKIIFKYESSNTDSGKKAPRLDQFIAEQMRTISRAQIQKLIDDGQILVDKKIEKAGYKPRFGQIIEITIPPPIASHIQPEPIALDIIFEDEYLAVVNKSAGMVTHPGAGVHAGTLVHALMHHMQGTLSGIGGVLRPGIVHRLDKDTSGLLVVAKSDQAHQHLAKQIQSKKAKRTYFAILEGRLSNQSGTVDAALGRHPTKRTQMTILKTGRNAQTEYQVLAGAEDALITKIRQYFSLAELNLHTGRTHQIRVHMASLNCPVVGDIVYNHKTTGSESARKRLGLIGQALHAYKLSFEHPISHKLLQFTAPIPQDLTTLIAKLFPDFSQKLINK